ncbi:MAG: exodeoxyribonuclease VII large subunit [Planctomycetes bacterium]|nr:exodeoxyribonuclease VII large subunit [Planctomycetota bacterium]
MRRGLFNPGGPEKSFRSSRTPSPREGVEEALTVGELTRRIKALLEGSLGLLTVRGEASGIKRSPSGHVYFSLKDPSALIDCVLWRSASERVGELPRDGDKVTVRGKLSVYEPRGRYQLVIVSFVSDAGKGDLWRRFEELKERLAAEGLFSPERKKPLPAYPRVIGVVTSPTGAALRDILKILARRSSGIRVVLSPCLVQGQGAAADIARALEAMDRWGGAEVIIVGRGGGSFEELSPFNEETVVRAIAAARTPVVSAVGHETDFTIADFAADLRAATPSEAAERAAPSRVELGGRTARVAQALQRALLGLVRERREKLAGVARSAAFRRPFDLFMPKWQRLDDLVGRMNAEGERRLIHARSRLELTGARLEALSPGKVLERGYAVVLDAGGKAVLDASSLSEGVVVSAVLHRGGFSAKVENVVGRRSDSGFTRRQRPESAPD